MEQNTVKFGVHKTFFFYTDDCYSPDKIGENIGIYDDKEIAKKVQEQLDVQVIRNLYLENIAHDFWNFYEKNGKEVEAQIIAYMTSIGFENNAGYNGVQAPQGSFFFFISNEMSDENIVNVLKIAGIYFHQVLEYKSFKSSAYVRMNYDFWGKKVFDKLKNAALLDSRSPYLSGESRKGYYLINKPPKGRKSAKFNSSDQALEMALRVFLESCKEFPENNFLGKTYVEEWSDQLFLTMAFLANCNSITLEHEEVAEVNQKQITAKLKKLKSNMKLDVGMRFFTVILPDLKDAIPEEVQGLIELLKVKPFEIFTTVSEVNGEELSEYYGEQYFTF